MNIIQKRFTGTRRILASSIAGFAFMTVAGAVGASTDTPALSNFNVPGASAALSNNASSHAGKALGGEGTVTVLQSSALPESPISDWSTYLDTEWKCGRDTGPRWDQWKKSVLLFAASNGYGFRGICNQSVALDDNFKLVLGRDTRPDTALIVFRDRNQVPQYVAWYDTQFDKRNNPVFGGITPLTAEIRYDVRQTPYWNYPLHSYTQAQQNDFHAYMLRLMDVTQPDYDFQLHQEVQTAFYKSIARPQGCNRPYWSCGTGMLTFGIPGGEATLVIDVSPESPELYAVGLLSEQQIRKDSWYEKLVMVGVTAGWTIIGGHIGEFIGLAGGTAGNAAFSAGFGSFTSGIIQGQNVNDALLNGLKGAGLAYTGTLILNEFGNPLSKVGVSGAGCPLGDQCWYFEMANGFPPLKRLAELHDPFINWSTRAFGSIGQNGWYKAVTIAPFVVPGCLASSGCIAAGITIVNEDEVH